MQKPLMLYDGLCPICAAEVRWLKSLKRADRVRFEDIAEPGFDPASYGLTMEEVIGSIHGQDHQGRVLKGIDLFMVIYPELGIGWLINWAKWPLLRPVAEAGYRVFARIRPKFSSLQNPSQGTPLSGAEKGRCKTP